VFRRGRRSTPQAEEPPSQTEQEILAALEALRDTTAREVMTPRVDVVALKAPVTLGDVTRAIRQSGHSRFPVYEEDLDQLAGVLFVKDLFRAAPNDQVLTDPAQVLVPAAPAAERGIGATRARLRRPYLVPEGRRVLDVLSEMRQRRNAFAVVVDEFGGVEGVITVKDLVSELVGELPDEFDRAEDAPIVAVDAGRWLVAGDCPVDDVNEDLGATIPEGEYVTLGGFLFDRFGHIPEEGETYEHNGWQYRVAEMDRRRVAKVVVRAPSGSIAAEAGPHPAAGK